MVQVQIRLSVTDNKINFVVEGLSDFDASDAEKEVGEAILRENVKMLTEGLKSASGKDPDVHEIPAKP